MPLTFEQIFGRQPGQGNYGFPEAAQAGGSSALQERPPSLEEILGLAGKQVGVNPVRQGSLNPYFGPSGNGQYIFTGGSPYPVDERPAMIQNAIALATKLSDAISKVKKKPATTGGG